MIMNRIISQLILTTLLILPCAASATIIFPALEIQNKVGDTGANLTTSTFDIDATVFAVITESGPVSIPDHVFTLSSTGTYDGSIGLFSGGLTVDGGLLSGTFIDLAVVNLGGGSLSYFGDVTFTGGSLMGPATGRIEGIVTDSSSIVAKLGTVEVSVPEPAIMTLLGTGLVMIGVISFSRRRCSL